MVETELLSMVTGKPTRRLEIAGGLSPKQGHGLRRLARQIHRRDSTG